MGGFQFLLLLRVINLYAEQLRGVIKSMRWFSVPFRDDLRAYNGNITVFLPKQLLSSLILIVIITDFECHHHCC